MTIVWAGIGSNEYEWTENFIKKKKKIHRPDRTWIRNNMSLLTAWRVWEF
ncbi:MAG: hypothetical protein IPL53_25040 [Ignavibacteria bacterium]|nr:hypothetical protein [Ignavibacteria bacterium]